MKTIYFLLLLVAILSGSVSAQVSINTDNSAPAPSAMLDVKSTSKGFLPPRMTKIQRDAISAPAEGLVVICTDCGYNNRTMISMFLNGSWQNFVPTTDVLSAPVPGTHIPYSDSIVWNWNAVPGAIGYKWGFTNVLSSAIDVGNALSKTEAGLNWSTSYTRYLWAYNDAGVSVSVSLTESTTLWTCGSYSFTINHVTTGNVAPENKSVTYGTAGPLAGEPDKCWISRNLGASSQATSPVDASDLSAGWYWQFNRKQGYKRNGGTSTPAWPSTGISENSEWLSSNDPCNLELGPKWRLPTTSEWMNIDASGGWTNYSGPYNSPLKLHAAGWISPDGVQYTNGVNGEYCTSAQNGTALRWSYDIREDNASPASIFEKTWGFSARCVSGPISVITTAPVTSVKATTAVCGGDVSGQGNFAILSRGVCWGTSPTPTISGNHTNDGSAMGTFTSAVTGLDPVTTYFIRAYVTSGNGTSYGSEVSFVTTIPFYCGYPFIVNHELANGVAPVAKIVTYGTVTNIPGDTSKCWITRNLGASQQATVVNDATESSAGWYWQFNRKKGYQHTGSTLTPAWTITMISENSDWQAVNDPCSLELGTAWRIPTNTEWSNVNDAGNWSTWSGPWGSGLKLHAAGYLGNSSGGLNGRGVNGNYWSGLQSSSSGGYYQFLNNVSSYTGIYGKPYGLSVRCLRAN